MNMNVNGQMDNMLAYLATQGTDLALKVAGAVAAWMIGRWLIALATRLLGRMLSRSGRLDVTLVDYLKSITSVLLTIMLVLGILSLFGVQTTSFAALLAGAGLAIGTAWGGLLTHFAAGVFMQVLRPYKVGDTIQAAGVTGTVTALGLFTTTITTADNVTTIVGNNKIFSDTIQNYSALPVRRVDCTAKLAHGIDPDEAIERLRAAVATVPHVAASPAPVIGILESSADGLTLCVRPYTSNADYGQVLFDTNRIIAETFRTAGYPVPAATTITIPMIRK